MSMRHIQHMSTRRVTTCLCRWISPKNIVNNEVQIVCCYLGQHFVVQLDRRKSHTNTQHIKSIFSVSDVSGGHTLIQNPLLVSLVLDFPIPGSLKYYFVFKFGWGFSCFFLLLLTSFFVLFFFCCIKHGMELLLMWLM